MKALDQLYQRRNCVGCCGRCGSNPGGGSAVVEEKDSSGGHSHNGDDVRLRGRCFELSQFIPRQYWVLQAVLAAMPSEWKEGTG